MAASGTSFSWTGSFFRFTHTLGFILLLIVYLACILTYYGKFLKDMRYQMTKLTSLPGT
jgi:hypothetical protein